MTAAFPIAQLQAAHGRCLRAWLAFLRLQLNQPGVFLDAKRLTMANLVDRDTVEVGDSVLKGISAARLPFELRRRRGTRPVGRIPVEAIAGTAGDAALLAARLDRILTAARRIPPGYEAAAFKLLFTLWVRACREGLPVMRVTYATLMAESGLKEDGVRRGLAGLTDGKLVSRRRTGRTWEYTLQAPLNAIDL